MSQRYYTCPTATLMDSYARRIRLSGPTASTLSGRGRAKARHRRPSPTLALPPCPKRGSRSLYRRSRSPPLCAALTSPLPRAAAPRAPALGSTALLPTATVCAAVATLPPSAPSSLHPPP